MFSVPGPLRVAAAAATPRALASLCMPYMLIFPILAQASPVSPSPPPPRVSGASNVTQHLTYILLRTFVVPPCGRTPSLLFQSGWMGGRYSKQYLPSCQSSCVECVRHMQRASVRSACNMSSINHDQPLGPGPNLFKQAVLCVHRLCPLLAVPTLCLLYADVAVVL